MPLKPNLTLSNGDLAEDVDQIIALFEQITGRKATPQEIEEVRAEIENPTDITEELPQAHFGSTSAAPPSPDADVSDDNDDDEELAETPADIVAMLGFDPAESDAGMAQDRMAFDRASVRTIDHDGRMHVQVTHISKANVCPYFGSEILNGAERIMNMDQSKIDPNKKYYLLRDPEELEKAAPTFNNIPLLSTHIAVTVDSPKKDLIIGSTGTDATFDHPYLDNSLVIWTADGIAGVDSGEQQEISCAYRYVADMTPGKFEGVPYDGVMRDIRGNHVALVAAGRAGPDVIVGDSKAGFINPMERNIMPSKSLSKKAVMAKGALLAVLLPHMAADSKPGSLSADLDTLLAGVKRKNWLQKKPGIIAAVKAKLAMDDDTIAQVIESLEQLDTENPSDNPEVAEDSPFEDVLEMLRGKISDEDLAAVKAKMEAHGAAAEPAAATDETAEEKAAREEKEGKLAGDQPPAFEGKPKDPVPVSKAAMDAAIQTAKKEATADAMRAARAITEAEEAVRPYVGKLAIAFDSADSVYKAALETMKVDIKDVHPSAYKAILGAQPRPGSSQDLRLVHDSAAPPDGFQTRFPESNRLKQA